LTFSARLTGTIKRIEELRITSFQWLLFFLAIVVARNFLEQFGPEKEVFNFPSFFIHFPFAYIAPVLALSIILSLLARERIERVTKLMLFAWFLTLIPPIIDLVIGRGAGSRIAYLYVDRGSILDVLVRFFNPAVHLEGTTPGIRVEAFIGCILACGYVWLKSKSFRRTIATLLVTYLTFILFFTLPYTFATVVSLFSPRVSGVGPLYFDAGVFLKGHVDRVACSIAAFDLVLITLLLLVWTRLHSREIFNWLFRRLRRFTPIHLGLALLFGILLALKALPGETLPASLHINDVIVVVSLLVSVTSMYWVSSASGVWRRWGGVQRFTTFAILAIGIFFSGLVGYPALVFSLSLLAFLLLYYAKPIDLSRYFPVGATLIALATLSCMLMGFSTVAGRMVPRFFPKEVILATILSCLLGFTAKDYVPDRRRGRPAAGLMLLLAFVSVGILLESAFLVWAGIVLGATAAAFLVLKIAVRSIAYTTYAMMVTLIGFMMVMDEIPFLLASEPLPEEILHIERGREFQIGRMFGHAAMEFEQATAHGWKDAETFFALGFAYEETGELAQSAYWYGKAVSLDTGYVEAYNNLGVVLRRLGDPDSAVVVLEKGVEKDPGSARLLRNMFLALFDSERYGELIPLLERYLSMNPDELRMREVLGDAYMRTGHLDAAETEYRMVLGMRRGYVPAIVGLGYIMANRGEVDEAEKYLLVALELDPENVDAMHRLGYIYLDRGDVQAAVVLFREIVKQEPLIANHYDSLGDAYVEAGEYEKAEKAYEMAVSLDSTAAQTRKKLKELERFR
jgi:tetratricopeptide (TPR) repeat protein